MSETFLYFAYGSNMFTSRLTERAPSAVAIGTAFVEGRRLTFDKRSKDGSGKCDIEATGSPADRVWGVLFRIASDEAACLDKAEGLDHGYCKGEVQALTPAGAKPAVAYFATDKDPGRLPYHWYKRYVIAGATEHHLPAIYIAGIRDVPSQEDPDAARRSGNEALLSGAPPL
jgi:hypothetical protein